MSRLTSHVRLASLVCVGCMAAAWAGSSAVAADPKPRLPAGAKPGTPAATPKPAAGEKPQAADGSKPVTIGPNLLTFSPPDGWLESPVNRRPTREIYFAATRNAMISVELLPAGATADKDVAAAMIRTLKQNRKTAKQTVKQEPTVENDDRFAVRIREKYMEMYKDGEKLSDQLHLYRMVGKRVLLVTMKTVADGEVGNGHRSTAEAVALSAQLIAK